jgi:hypothetical protein
MVATVLTVMVPVGSVALAADGGQVLPRVVEQFEALTERPDPLGFFPTDSPDATSCKHYQSMVRVNGADGVPYFVVSKSGIIPDVPGPDDQACGEFLGGTDDPGSLLVVRMGSRDRTGERLRSNRLVPDVDLADSAPSTSDHEIWTVQFDGVSGWPDYGHPGAMSKVDDVIALALESPYEAGLPAALVLFIDVSDPTAPHILNHFEPVEVGEHCGTLGVLKQADGTYLMVVTGGHNTTLYFYRGAPITSGIAAPLGSSNLGWTLIDTWEAAEGVRPGGPGEPLFVPLTSPDEVYLEDQWPTDPAHQTLQFLQDAETGTLYLAGARGKILFGDDLIDLYRMDFDGAEIRLKHITTSHKNSHPSAEGNLLNPFSNTANFAAASSFYVSPAGELIFYASSHDDDGAGGGIVGRGSVEFGEWRNVEMVRPDSPTLLPRTLINPAAVAEGGTTTVFGLGLPPVTKAWIQFFSDDDFDGRYVVVDYDDRGKDSFGDFSELDGSPFDLHSGFNDEASSWRFFAPFGCTIRANDDDFGDDDFPGSHTRTLPGRGFFESAADLSSTRNDDDDGDMDDELTSVQFFDDCDDYYHATMLVSWDTDGDGTFETEGTTFEFDAAELDGPSKVEVKARAQHPIDFLLGAPATTLVDVVNVPPVIGTFEVKDSLGNLVTQVPFVLLGLPVTAAGTFTDRGKPDHQTASLNWGDGVIDPGTSFASFHDAFGGAVGALSQAHRYAGAGTFPIGLGVLDDDGGLGSATASVRVVTAEQALSEILGMLDALIAPTSGKIPRKYLLKARDHIDGEKLGAASNGAIDLLRLSDRQAAYKLVLLAIEDLQAAQAAGSDVALLITLLQQVAASLQV